MIQRFLKFAVRKDIPRKNKKINHKVLVASMTMGQKIPHLAKWHKKKLIASVLALIIIYTYDLQKRTNIQMLSNIQESCEYEIANSLPSKLLCARANSPQYYFGTKLPRDWAIGEDNRLTEQDVLYS